jgi:hypothetical protein
MTAVTEIKNIHVTTKLEQTRVQHGESLNHEKLLSGIWVTVYF